MQKTVRPTASDKRLLQALVTGDESGLSEDELQALQVLKAIRDDRSTKKASLLAFQESLRGQEED